MTTPKNINQTISREITAFIVDRRAARRSENTIRFYSKELEWFLRWLDDQEITRMDELTSRLIREYMLHLGKTRNDGGVHAGYRSIRAWIYWYADEVEAPEYRKIMQKVSVARPSDEPLPGISPEDLKRMLATCRKKDIYDQRDKATLLFLYDTGLRAQEFIDLNFEDINLDTGEIAVRHGKGDKPRTVYLGGRAMKEFIRFTRFRDDVRPLSPVWISLKGDNAGQRITYYGLREILRRCAAEAAIEEPTAHDFRRAFCLQFLKNGGDLFTLQRLTGHKDLKTLARYLALAQADLETAHRKASPADNL